MAADYTDPPAFPEGTPEHDAYRSELRTELGKFAKGDAPYGYPDTTDYCASLIHTGNYTGSCGKATPCPDHDEFRMTVAEIALMREIVRWRKANGWLFQAFAARWVESRTGRAVSYDPYCSEVGTTSNYHGGPNHWYRVQSVTAAVDVLVAFGYLPARFSSAYRAGWDALDGLRTRAEGGKYVGSAEWRRVWPAGGTA